MRDSGVANNAPAKKKKLVKKKPPPPKSEAAAGSGFGLTKANEFKKTRVFKKAARPVVGRGVGSVVGAKTREAEEIKKELRKKISNAGRGGQSATLGAIQALRTISEWDPIGGRKGHTGIASIDAQRAGPKILTDIAEATAREPAKTIEGGAKAVIGTVGAVGDVTLPVLDAAGHLVTGRPGKALKDLERSGKAVVRLGEGIPADLKRRYGPYFTGKPEEARERLRKEGAGPELIDLALVATGGGKVVGPGARKAVRASKKGREFMDAPRPKLRISGGKTVTQTVGPTITRTVVQRSKDRVRQYAVEHPGKVIGRRHRPDAEGRKAPLQPQSPVRKSIERHNRKVARKGGKPVTVPRRPEEVVPLTKVGEGRAQRIAISRHSATSYLRNRREQQIELAGGAERALAGLSGKQRRAAFHVLQGLVPVHGSVAEIVRALKEHKKALKDAPGAIPVLRKSTELGTIDFLIKHADEIFGDGRLKDFHAGEVARGKRVARNDPGVRAATAQARVYRPQGERLGIPYKEPAEGLSVAERDAHNLAYVAKVQAAAAKRGLPEPVYFQHNKHPTVRVSARTASNVGRAVKGPKQSRMTLFREGRAITAPDMYIQGLADTIKRKHQWDAVADVAADNAFHWSLGPTGKGLPIDVLKTEMAKRGLRENDVVFIDFGRVRQTSRKLEHAEAIDQANVSAALDSAVYDPATKGLVPTGGRYMAVPRAAGKELQDAMRPMNKPLRVAGKAQGLQSALILGLNPSWLGMQIAANTLQAGIGMRGNLLDIVRAQKWYRNLSPEMKAVVDDAANVGVYEGHTNAAHLGYHQGNVSKAFERVGQVPVVRTKRGTVRVTDANPVRLMFRGDKAQNAAFRKAVLFNALKREHFHELTQDVGRAQAALAHVSTLLKGDAVKQLDNVLRDPRKVEQAARYTDEVLGDYLRFTARERRYFKSFVMFYGFLRYATKTLFYTLPVGHPLAAAITLKLGQLHNEEVYDIFGTRDLPPWVLSRSYEYDEQGQIRRDDQGRPMYRDLARINPLTGPIIDAVTEGPQAIAGLVSPLFQGAADVIAGRNIQTGVPIRVNRGTAEADVGFLDPDLPQIMLNRIVRATLPGRALIGPGAQSDDALPFRRQPLRYKTEAAKQRDEQRMADAPTVGQQLAPLLFPRADTTQAYLDREGLGRVGQINEAIDTLEKRKARLERTGRHVENGSYPTREYDELRTGLAELAALKKALLNEPTKPEKKRLKPRPETTRRKLRKSVEELRNRDIRQEVLDEIARLKEQAKIDRGG